MKSKIVSPKTIFHITRENVKQYVAKPNPLYLKTVQVSYLFTIANL